MAISVDVMYCVKCWLYSQYEKQLWQVKADQYVYQPGLGSVLIGGGSISNAYRVLRTKVSEGDVVKIDTYEVRSNVWLNGEYEVVSVQLGEEKDGVVKGEAILRCTHRQFPSR